MVHRNERQLLRRQASQRTAAMAQAKPPDDAELPDSLVFSCSLTTVEASTSHELPIPTKGDGFIFYSYNNYSGDMRFEVHDADGRVLLEELQTSSNEQLRVKGTPRCTLRWVNDSWMEAKELSYSIRVASDRDIADRMQARLLRATRAGQLDAVREALTLGAPPDGTDEAGYTPLMTATLGHQREARAAASEQQHHLGTLSGPFHHPLLPTLPPLASPSSSPRCSSSTAPTCAPRPSRAATTPLASPRWRATRRCSSCSSPRARPPRTWRTRSA